MFSFLFSGKLKVKDVLFLSSSRIFYLSLRTHFSEEVTYSSLTQVHNNLEATECCVILYSERNITIGRLLSL